MTLEYLTLWQYQLRLNIFFTCIPVANYKLQVKPGEATSQESEVCGVSTMLRILKCVNDFLLL